MFGSIRIASGIAVAAAVIAASPVAAAAPSAGSTAGTADRGYAQHAVFVQTNVPTGNQVVAFSLGANGRIDGASSYDTGGSGLALNGAVADKLASQGSLTYDAEHRLLYAVNGGSNTLSVFAVRGAALTLRQVVSTNGIAPVSVAVHGDLVYVLNAITGSIQGFRLEDGSLAPIAFSNRSLNLTPVFDQTQFLNTPGQIGFSPDGRHLIVTTKLNGSDIDVFGIGRDGRPSATFVANPSATPVPFGFTFDRDEHLVVTEVADSNFSTYTLNADGTLDHIGSVSDGQKALCWVTRVGRFFYGANAGSNTLSGFTLDAAGQPAPIDPPLAIVANTGAGPVDMASTPDGRQLFVQLGKAGTVEGYRVNAGGTLTQINDIGGLGGFEEGIAAD